MLNFNFRFDGDQWVAYDDKQTIDRKIKFATDNCLIGIMMWSIDQDDGLIQTVTPRIIIETKKCLYKFIYLNNF